MYLTMLFSSRLKRQKSVLIFECEKFKRKEKKRLFFVFTSARTRIPLNREKKTTYTNADIRRKIQMKYFIKKIN